MSSENLPVQPSPERPPLAPYDPPEQAPQAQAWRRALKVIGCTPPSRQYRVGKISLTKVTVRRSTWA
jgi:hypothetical protein